MTADTESSHRFVRSDSDRMIAGVCGGLAAHLDVDATLVRIVFVVLALVHGLGLVVYVVLAAITPRAADAHASTTRDVLRDNAVQARAAARRAGDDLRAAYRRYRSSSDRNAADPAPDGDAGSPPEPPSETVPTSEPLPPPPPPRRSRPRGGWGFGAVLIALGIFLLARNLGLFFWIDWGTWWPLILIAVGGWMLIRRVGE